MRTGKSFAIISVGILATVMLLWQCPSWLLGESWWIALLHHFFHASPLHLIVNSYSLYVILTNREITAPSLISAYICASLSWFCSSSAPVGISNIIFALIGMTTPALSNSWWRQPGTIIFFAINIILFLFPQVSAITHLVSFALGCVCAICMRLYKSLADDFRRAAYH